MGHVGVGLYGPAGDPFVAFGVQRAELLGRALRLQPQRLLKVLFVANQHLHQGDILCNRLLGFLRTPEFGPKIQIETGRHPGPARRLQRLQGCGRRPVRKGRRDAAHMEPLCALKDRLPVHHSRFDIRNRRVAPVVGHRAGPGANPHLHMVEPVSLQAHPVKRHPDNRGHVHPMLSPLVPDQHPRPVVYQPGDPRRIQAQMGAADGHVILPAPHLHIQPGRILQPPVFGRRKPDHRLSEGNHIAHRSALPKKSVQHSAISQRPDRFPRLLKAES